MAQKKYSNTCILHFNTTMNIPDFDAEFCGTLPLNQINHIQPYGFLLVTDKKLQILQVSDNISGLTTTGSDKLPGMGLKDLFGEQVEQAILARLKFNSTRFSLPLTFKAEKEINLSAIVSFDQDFVFVELEKQDKHLLLADTYHDINSVLQMLESAPDFEHLLQESVTALKNLSGFDKVMIYRFDENWNGHVVAEAMEPGMDSYLDLHFPASDIPRPAREMYKKNPYRLIPDASYKPVPLYPIVNPTTKKFTDLSSCNLRGVARVHLEYLSNMKVGASMSTRIVKNNQLWGLISCHHQVPRRVTHEKCILFELVSNLISSRLTALEIAVDALRSEKQQGAVADIIRSLYSAPNVRDSLYNAFSKISQFYEADGIAYISNNHVSRSGKTPNDAQLMALSNWLHAKNFQGPFITNHIASEYRQAEEFSEDACGMVVLPIMNSQNEYLFIFREERKKSIAWGGNPHDAVTFEDGQKQNYHPRNSFAVWKQLVTGTSLPFDQHLARISSDLQRVLLSQRLAELSN